MEEKGFVLSMEELMILAAGSGIDQFYGIRAEDIPQFTQETYMQQILEMVEHGHLQKAGDRVSVAPKYQRIFGNIRDAKRLLLCYPGENHMPQRCFYCGSQIAVMENSVSDSKKVKVDLMDVEKMVSELLDESYFPEGIPVTDPMFESATLETAFDGYFPPVEQILTRKEMYLVIDAVDSETGEVNARLCITKNPFGFGMLYQKEKEINRYFIKEQMISYVKSMVTQE